MNGQGRQVEDFLERLINLGRVGVEIWGLEPFLLDLLSGPQPECVHAKLWLPVWAWAKCHQRLNSRYYPESEIRFDPPIRCGCRMSISSSLHPTKNECIERFQIHSRWQDWLEMGMPFRIGNVGNSMISTKKASGLGERPDAVGWWKAPSTEPLSIAQALS